ncbi:MAG: hypothetical protein A3A97_04300 [Candidatus Terrybacteria bacterium RIFCSPLOWO2_01_FULL_40_23]|uniref:Uncharacterized protein n=1 Tax=Candidatus Terrybacteria bacterium RIFCSPLOWO2_01_FULL_40_23 TaxID=1802366 RepID=A0A1G2PZ63_9BACT|nr:MAG: hypothetical protein A3A97_04300 [Candidatus Terrybacteria bacterium RIFCSPLOWO2_01_FULL_40_23]
MRKTAIAVHYRKAIGSSVNKGRLLIKFKITWLIITIEVVAADSVLARCSKAIGNVPIAEQTSKNCRFNQAATVLFIVGSVTQRCAHHVRVATKVVNLRVNNNTPRKKGVLFLCVNEQ